MKWLGEDNLSKYKTLDPAAKFIRANFMKDRSQSEGRVDFDAKPTPIRYEDVRHTQGESNTRHHRHIKHRHMAITLVRMIPPDHVTSLLALFTLITFLMIHLSRYSLKMSHLTSPPEGWFYRLRYTAHTDIRTGPTQWCSPLTHFTNTPHSTAIFCTTYDHSNFSFSLSDSCILNFLRNK
jgi:hypothetical protein